jgi:hypothetical protein
MIRIRRARPGFDPLRHLDDATLTLLLRGDAIAGTKEAAGHLAGCAVCRHRMETADPLLLLFEDAAPLPWRPVSVPLPSVRRVPRPRWQLSGGLAVAAAAAVALTVSHQSPSAAPQQAQARSEILRITTVIRTAAQRHDETALRHALGEARAELRQIDAAHADPSLSAALAALRSEVASLPSDPDTVALVAGVEAVIPAPAATATPEPAPEATAQPLPADPPPAEPMPQPTPEPTPDPAPAATPEATPTPDATPAPDPAATPAATPTDPTPPF